MNDNNMHPGLLERAEVVAARAAILAENDDSIDLASLITGLWIGHEGEMPEALHYGILGCVMTMALSKIEAYNGPEVRG